MNKAPGFVRARSEQRDAFARLVLFFYTYIYIYISRNDIWNWISRLQLGVLASTPLLHRRLRTTASYLPREERYPVKSITNDDRTTCRGMRLVPRGSWPYFGIRYSKLACLRSSARHIASGYRRRSPSFCSPCATLRFSFSPPIRPWGRTRYVNGAGSFRVDVRAGSRGRRAEKARAPSCSGGHDVVEATEGGAAMSKAPRATWSMCHTNGRFWFSHVAAVYSTCPTAPTAP